MLKSELLHEKTRLANLLDQLLAEKNLIVAIRQQTAEPGRMQSKIREINQKILEVQEEMKALDLKLR